MLLGILLEAVKEIERYVGEAEQRNVVIRTFCFALTDLPFGVERFGRAAMHLKAD